MKKIHTLQTDRPLFRAISLTVVVSMGWMDVAWALDPRQKLLDDLASFETLADGQKYSSPEPISTDNELMAIDAVTHQEDLAGLMASAETQAPVEAETAAAPVYPQEITDALNADQADIGTAEIRYEEEEKLRTTQTQLSVNALRPAARASGWSINTRNKTLTNATGGRYLEYRVTVPYTGALRVDLSALATGSRALPDDYDAFRVAVYVDGVRMDTLEVTADKSAYHSDTVMIENVEAGMHRVRLIWENDAPNKAAVKKTKTSPAKPATGTQITLRDIVFSSVTREPFPPADFAVLSAVPAETNRAEFTVLYRLDGVEKERTLSLEEGVNDFVIEETDVIGRKVSASFSVTRDTTPPELFVTEGPPAVTNMRDLVIRYSADGVLKERSFELTEGPNEVYILEKDALGNASYRTFDVTLDTAPPVILPLTEIPALTRMADWTFEYLSDGVRKSKTFTLKEGVNALSLTETDDAGNRAVWEREVTLDTIAPEITVMSGPDPVTNAAAGTIVYTADGVEKNMTYELTEGLNRVTVEESDAAGNVARVQIDVTLDTRPPVIELSGEREILTNKPRYDLAYTVDGVQKVRTLDLTEGLNHFTIQERDETGNVSDLEVWIHLDTVPPMVDVLAEPPAATRDSVITVEFKIDTYQYARKEFSLNEGENVLRFETADLAGNVTVWERTVTRDTTPPALGDFSPVPDSTELAAITVTYTADGEAKTKRFDLALGQNVLRIEGSDALGNTSVREFDVMRLPASGIKVLSAPPAVTDLDEIVIDYSIAGETRSKRFALKVGENVLTVRDIDAIGDERVERVWITRTGQAPIAGSGMTLKTAADDTLIYDAGVLTQATTASGDVLKNLRLDGNGQIVDAEVRLADGTVQVLENGAVIGSKSADGTVHFYREGFLEKIVSAAGEVTRFDRQSDRILAEGPHVRAVYTTDGEPLTVEDLATGRVTRFVNGVARSVVWPDGTEVLYAEEILPDGTVRYFAPQTAETDPVLQEGLPYREAVYSEEGLPVRITLWDGNVIAFDGTGRVANVTDADGESVGIDWSLSAAGYLVRMSLAQSTLTSEYDAAGALSAVDTGDLVLHYKDGAIDHIEMLDGTILYDVGFDENGDVVSARIVEADGGVKHYANGEITLYISPDGTVTRFENGKAVAFESPQNVEYTLSYSDQGIQADIDPSFVSDLATPIRMHYDAAMNLKQTVRADGQISNFFDNRLQETVLSTGEVRTYEYTVNAAGEDITRVHEGRLTTVYNAMGQPTESVLAATADDPNEIRTIYRYGKIREVQKNGETTLLYSYVYEADGRELTQVKDLGSGVLKTYADGLMIRSLETSTGVLSEHTYVDGKTSSVRLSRLGRELSVYRYAYSGAGEDELTLVTDPSGAVRVYDASHRLTRVDKDGTSRAYSQMPVDPDDPSAGTVTRETIARRVLAGGSEALYQDGKVTQVTVASASGSSPALVTGVRYGEGGQFENARVTGEDGITRVFDADEISEQIFADGGHAYYDQGRLTRYEAADGRAYDYAPGDAAGETKVTTDGMTFEYAADGSLRAYKIDGVMTPQEAIDAREVATDGYGYYDYAAYDGDWSTAFYYGSGGGEGGRDASLSVQHRFDEPQAVESVRFHMRASASASGHYDRWREARLIVEAEIGGVWVTVPGASWGGGTGGDGTIQFDSGLIELDVDLKNVTAIRAYAQSHAHCSGGECSASAFAEIYDMDYVLADSSVLTAAIAPDAVTLSGPKGLIAFDGSGRVAASTLADASVAARLDGRILDLLTVPYSAAAQLVVPPGFDRIRTDTLKSQIAADEVYLQEYSSDGTLEVQSKGDRTTTLYNDAGKPERVLDGSGSTMIEYTYDASGELERILLKKAREELPQAITQASADIEARRAAALEQLADSRDLATSQIRTQADSAVRQIQDQLLEIQSGRASLEGRDVSGKQARNAKAQALAQYDGIITQSQTQLSDVYRQESEALEKLDDEVQRVSQEIYANTVEAVTNLTQQQQELERHILLQEITPVAFDAYRRLLGRDPSTQEYQGLLDRLDYRSGEIVLTTATQDTTVPLPTVSFDGDGDYLQVDDPYRTLTAGDGDFEVETQLSVDNPSINQTLWDLGGWRNGVKLAYQGSQRRIEWHVAGQEYGVWDFEMTPGRVYDLKLERKNGMLRMWVDGALIREDANTSFISAHEGFRIGYAVTDTNHLDGHLASLEVRLGGEPVFYIAPAAEDEYVRDLEGGLTVYAKGNAALDPAVSYLSKELTTTSPASTQGLLAYLTDRLTGSEEQVARQAFVAGLKDRVGTAVTEYLSLDADGRRAYAAALGIGADEAVALSDADAAAVMDWIRSGGLHFGQSAFNAMQLLLKEKNLTVDPLELAARTVLIDILAGVISPLDEGDLVLSMYAMKKALAAGGYAAEAVSTDYAALQKIYDDNRVLTEEKVVTDEIRSASVDLSGGRGYLTAKDQGRDLDFGTGDFTIESWINLDGTGVTNTIASKNTNPSGWIFFVRNDQIGLYDNWNVGPKHADVTVTPHVWHHVAVTRTGNTLRYFLDGKVVGIFGLTGETFGGSDADLIVGAYNSGTAGRFEGKMEELTISRESLYQGDFTPQEVKQSVRPSTAFLMRAEDTGSGPWLKDLSRRARTLTLQGQVVKNALDTRTFVLDVTRSTVVTRGPPDADPSRLDDYNPRVIAHIQGNHYVTLINVTDEEVTYIDTSVGPDGDNEVVTISKEEFLKAWQGNVLIDQDLALKSVQDDPISTKVLSAQEAMSVRGAFFGNILGILGTIFTFAGMPYFGLALTGIASIVSAIEGDWMSAISNIVTFGFGGGFSEFFGSVFQGISGALGSVGSFIKGAFEFVARPVKGFLDLASQGLSTLLDGIPSVASAAKDAIKTAVATGINFGVSKGLEALGVSPEISGLLGQFTSGALLGAVKDVPSGAAYNQLDVIKTNVFQINAMQNGLKLGSDLGIAPELTQVFALGLGAITGDLSKTGNATGDLAKAFRNVMPNITGSLSQMGLAYAGEGLGIDSQIPGLIGLPITNALGGSSRTRQEYSERLLINVQDGILSGAVGYGITKLSNTISPASPLATGLLARTLTGLIDGFLNPNMSMLQGASQALTDSFANFIKSTATSDFANLVSQKGLIQAIEDNATGIFTRDALEEIVKAGGIAQVLSGSARYTQIAFGSSVMQVKEVTVGSTKLYFSAYDDSDLFGRQIGNRFERGYFGYDDRGNVVLRSGEIEVEFGNGQTTLIKIDNYAPIGYEIRFNGQPVAVSYQSNGEYLLGTNLTTENGVFESKVTGAKIVFKDGFADEIYIPGPEDQALQIQGSMHDLSAEEISSLVAYLAITSNGIGNTMSEGQQPAYMRALNSAIEASSGDASRIIMPVPLYEDSKGFYGKLQDVGTWLGDVIMGTDLITNEMLTKIQQSFAANTALTTLGATMVLYSGAGNPGLKASQKVGLNVKSVVLIGTPILQSVIGNPNTNTVVQIFGENDVLGRLVSPPRFFKTEVYGEEIDNFFQIQIKGIGHTDYMTDNAAANPKMAKVMREVAALVDMASSPDVLIRYLDTPKVWYSKDENTGKYILDPEKLPEIAQ